MPTEKEIPKPAEFTLDYLPFNRIVLRAKNSPGSNRLFIYDGRGTNFVRYPETGGHSTAERISSKHMDDHILFGMASNTGYKRWFACYMEDCFYPPMYLVNADNESDAIEYFQEDFEKIMLVDDSEAEVTKAAQDLCNKDGQNWDDLKDSAQGAYKDQAIEAKLSSGEWAMNGNGNFVYSEAMRLIELEVVRAEVRANYKP